MAIICGACGGSMGETLRSQCPHCGCKDLTQFYRGDSPEPATASGKAQAAKDRAFLEKRKDENLTRVMAMPTLGHGTFVLGGKRMRLPIVKMGKRDVTLRCDKDGGLIILNKKDLEKVEDP